MQCVPDVCALKPTKPNLTRTSPAKSLTPSETKGKEMPRIQKSNGINAKCDFPVPLDPRPGKTKASSHF